MNHDLLRAAALAAMLIPGTSFGAVKADRAGEAAPSWETAKADAQRWTAALLSGVEKDGRYDVESFKTHLAEAWRLAANIERAQRSLDRKRAAAVPAEKRLSRRMLELNLLYVYGNVFPRVIDESTDFAVPGRVYAGGELKTSIDEETYRARDAALRNASHAPADLMPELPGPEPQKP